MQPTKTDAEENEGFPESMLTTILYSSLKLEVEPTLWLDVRAVKEAVERLQEVSLDYFRPLDEVKEQLNINPSRHTEFLEFGGANALWDLLKKGNSVMQRKCMRAIEVLAKNDAPRRKLREIGIGDTFLDIIRASARRPESTRRAKSGEILKLLAGSTSSAVLFGDPRRNASIKTKHSARFSSKKRRSHLSSNLYGFGEARERRVPYWYYTTNPILPWDTETVSSLVDLLLSTGVQESLLDCARRIVRKILYIGQITSHVIIDPADISGLIRIITSMHSASIHAIKAVTTASIMHSANGLSFVKNEGIEALVSSLTSDNMGSICGEMSAWAVAHFCRTSEDAVRRVIAAGGAEALTELSHSTDKCSREAAIYSVTTLIRHTDKQKKTLLKRLDEADIISSTMTILDDHIENPGSPAIVLDSLSILLRMAKSTGYRAKICQLNGVEIVAKCCMDGQKSITEKSQRLQRLLSARSQRLSIGWKTSGNKTGKSLKSRIVHRLKKVFKPDSENTVSNTEDNPQPSRQLQHVTSLPTNAEREVEENSISTLSSSVHSEACNHLLATAPEGGAGMTYGDFLDNNPSPEFRTYTTQPFSESRGYDKDFDPFIFGGRPLPLNPKDPEECSNPDEITTHDFL